jgi:hypothetical protein
MKRNKKIKNKPADMPINKNINKKDPRSSNIIGGIIHGNADVQVSFALQA